MISFVVAMTNQGVIGNQGKLPWHISEEIRLFRQITMGSTIIMGRKTHESIGKALPGRHNVIMTRSPSLCRGDGLRCVQSATEALQASGPEAMVIGGSEIFSQFLPLCDRIYLSVIRKDYDGDVFFPISFLKLMEFPILSSTKHDEFDHLILKVNHDS